MLNHMLRKLCIYWIICFEDIDDLHQAINTSNTRVFNLPIFIHILFSILSKFNNTILIFISKSIFLKYPALINAQHYCIFSMLIHQHYRMLLKWTLENYSSLMICGIMTSKLIIGYFITLFYYLITILYF